MTGIRSGALNSMFSAPEEAGLPRLLLINHTLDISGPPEQNKPTETIHEGTMPYEKSHSKTL